MDTLQRFIMSDFIYKLMSFKTVGVLAAIYFTLQLLELIVRML